MAAFLKMGDIEGQSGDSDHDKWINLESISAPISRSIEVGAKDQGRTRGTTTMGDINLSRPLDKSSVKLAEACAKGTFFKEAEIHLTTELKGKEEPFLKYKLKNVIVTGYNFHGTSSGQPQPSETISLNFTDIDWTYVVIDPETSDKQSNVAASYSLSK